MESTDDEEDDEFKVKISEFPSSFILNDAIKLEKKESFECNKLEEELKDGYSTNEEAIRTKNLVSYLAWRLGNKDRAFTLCEENLAVDPSNIIALSNKGQFLRYSTRYHEADGVLKTLQLLQRREDFDCSLTSAEAEMAYSYSRFGPRYHEKSIQLFEKVIKKEPDKNIWKFGLALTYRRETHVLNSCPKDKETYEKHYSKALGLFCEIVSCEYSEKSLTAKAWCELGQILFRKSKQETIFSCLPKSIGSMSSEECFLRALFICPDDIFVLQRCGKQFRYFKKIDKSIEYLKRAQSIRETPFNLHHLALSLMKQVENERNHSRRRLNLDVKTAYPKSKTNFELSTQHLTSQMSKLSISSHTYKQSQTRTCTPTLRQTHNKSHGKSAGDAPFCFTLPDRNKPDNGHRRTQRSEEVEYGNETRTYSGNFRYQPSIRPTRGRGYSFKRQAFDYPRYTKPNESASKLEKLRIKSPKKVAITPDCPVLLEAADCLQRAIFLRGGKFNQALYDLGLVYRKLGEINQAIETFNRSYNIRTSSKLEKVRAMEQIGLCKLHLSYEKECSEEQAEIYYSDAKKNLYRAVSLMAGLCSLQPKLENALNCFPTLRSLLTEEKNHGNLSATKDLAELHTLMGNYKDAISLYEDVKDCLQDETPRDVLLNLLENYEKVRDFDNAILLLNLMMVSEDTKCYIDSKHYINLHILAWEFYAEENEKQMATHYLKNGLIFAKQKVRKEQNSEDETTAFILCPCGERPCFLGESIKMQLASLCDITASHNTKDCLPGTRLYRYMADVLEHCDFILLLNSCECTSELYKHFMEVVLTSDEFRSKAVLIERAVKDPCYRTLKQIPQPDSENVTIGWLKTLLNKLLL
ncbi:hypothetical protein FSP39_013161 [Pinctada imbricata]|uniref:Uncharacterized protein n=1 Tax=Pinctada imbricata TaxID=66713 RepID=A0AA88XIZ5_PINIB|nr:hypothetical protein FSP39_013161 [Pinctada imbricata]